MTWVKKTASNIQSLVDVPDEKFVTIERPFGSVEPQQIVCLADTEISFDFLGVLWAVVLETDENLRHGIFTMKILFEMKSLRNRRFIPFSSFQKMANFCLTNS